MRRRVPRPRLQPELLSALARCADGMLRQFGPQELTNTVWSFSQMSKQGVALPPDVNVSGGRLPAMTVARQDAEGRAWGLAALSTELVIRRAGAALGRGLAIETAVNN